MEHRGGRGRLSARRPGGWSLGAHGMVARQRSRPVLRWRGRQQLALPEARRGSLFRRSLPAGTATRNRFLPDLALPTALDSGFNPGLAFCLSTAASGLNLRLHPRAQRRQRRGHSHLCRRRRPYRSENTGRRAISRPASTPPAAAMASSTMSSREPRNCLARRAVQAAALMVRSAIRPLPATISPRDWACPMCRRWSIASHPPPLRSDTLTIPHLSPAQANNTYNPSAAVTFTAKVVDPTGAGHPHGRRGSLDPANYDMLTPVANACLPVEARPQEAARP